MERKMKSSVRRNLDEQQLFEYAVGALARKMRSVHELKNLMRARVEPGEAGEQRIDSVVKRLKELRYLSDTRFAADYTRLRRENEKYGQRRVQQDLLRKGVAKDLVAAAIGKAYEETDEAALAREYIARKRISRPSGDDASKQAARIMGRLLRAGFAPGTIYKVLREWDVEVEEIEVDEAMDADETQ